MGKHRATPTTALGAAIQARRGASTLAQAASESGLGLDVLSRLERGQGVRRRATRDALAAWLGWTVEQVIAAAGQEVSCP